MYDYGMGTGQNFKEAVKWYRKAAEQGDAEAQYSLGVMYAKGEGVAKNFRKAVKWYRKAAEQGDAEAQFNLGVMYAKGEGVQGNLVAAHAWLSLAAAQGSESAIKIKDWPRLRMSTEQVGEAEKLAVEFRERIESSKSE